MKMILVVALLLPTTAVAQSAPPPESVWAPKVDAYLEQVLKDPYSAVKRVSRGPRWGTFKTISHSATGWGICYSVNAKNSYGGYVGAKNYLFVLSDDRTNLTRISGEDLKSTYAQAVTDNMIDEECARPADPPGDAP